MNRFIIDYLEKNYNKYGHINKTELLLSLLFSFGLYGAMITLSMHTIVDAYKKNDYYVIYDNIDMFQIPILLFFTMRVFIVASNQLSTRFAIIYLLHCLVPGKHNRQREVDEYLRVNYGVRDSKPKKGLPDNPEWIVTRSISSLEELEEVVENVISPARAIKKLFYNNTHIQNGIIDDTLLMWALFVPMHQLDDNRKLEVLKYCKFDEKLNRPSGSIICLKDFENYWVNYSAKDVLRIFGSIFNGVKYFNSFMEYSAYTKEPLPVRKHMKDLIKYMNDYVYLYKEGLIVKEYDYPKKLDNIQGDSELGEIKRVNNFSELAECARVFSNCARVYARKCAMSNCFFYYILNKRNQPYILFHLSPEGRLLESKYKANGILSIKDGISLKRHIDKKISC